jgi:hypothetical protein
MLNVTAITATWHAAKYAEANARWWGYAGDDESHDARARRRSARHGGNAT